VHKGVKDERGLGLMISFAEQGLGSGVDEFGKMIERQH
jgi:hypothetical protein